jgi:phosphoserine phosphatase
MGRMLDTFVTSTIDPLASWRAGTVKSAIVEFVTAVTQIDGPDYVSPEERIAVFDNDGTLWSERPVQFQIYFALSRLEELARKNPSLWLHLPYKAFLEHDIKAIAALSKREALEPAFATHAGMTPREFTETVKAWLAEAKHPTLGRLFKECAYLPQLELLRYLRASGFSRYIVSGGGMDFLRAFAEDLYGVPAAQVIGSSVKTQFEIKDGAAVLVKLPEINSFNDGEAKVENIQLHIGRRPILAFGNSDGDLAMMRYTMSGKGRRMALLLHHDDKEREFAYDRDFKLSPLAKALDNASRYGLSVVSMKRDWKRIYRARFAESSKAA